MATVELTSEMMEVLVFAATIPEMTVYAKSRQQDYVAEFPLIEKYPQIFAEGFALREAMLLVFSADSFTDYEHDTKHYDSLAEALNAKYGKVALLTTDSGPSLGKPFAIGIIGHRLTPFGRVTSMEKGKEPVVTYPQAEVDAEDAIIREQIGKTQ